MILLSSNVSASLISPTGTSKYARIATAIIFTTLVMESTTSTSAHGSVAKTRRYPKSCRAWSHARSASLGSVGLNLALALVVVLKFEWASALRMTRLEEVLCSVYYCVCHAFYYL